MCVCVCLQMPQSQHTEGLITLKAPTAIVAAAAAAVVICIDLLLLLLLLLLMLPLLLMFVLLLFLLLLLSALSTPDLHIYHVKRISKKTKEERLIIRLIRVFELASDFSFGEHHLYEMAYVCCHSCKLPSQSAIRRRFYSLFFFYFFFEPIFSFITSRFFILVRFFPRLPFF